MVHNMMRFNGEELLTPRRAPKLYDHPLSAVRDCLLNIFAVTLLFWRPFLHPQSEDALVISVMQGISWLAENRLASQEELCSMDTVSSGFSKRRSLPLWVPLISTLSVVTVLIKRKRLIKEIFACRTIVTVHCTKMSP